MKKESYKNLIKRLKKSAIYLAVVISITVASVVSMVLMRKNMVSSIEQDTQKMFSSNSETIDSILPVNNQTLENEQDKREEKISYVTYEEKREDEQSKEESTKEKNAGREDTKQQEITNEKVKANQDKKEDESNVIPNDKQDKKEAKEVFFEGKKSFIVPVSGEIVNDYSCDKLIYSKTLDEWRVHQGIDITAKEGTNVKAVLDGYVEEIKNDDEYGVTVVVRHSKSLASVYKNLANEIVVLPNQIIKQGDVVGLVGNTGKIETELSPHLHFEMLKNNKIVDPKIYIQF